MKKIIPVFLLTALLVLFAVGAAAYTDTVLISENSTASAQSSWKPNTDRLWMLAYDRVGKTGKYLALSSIEKSGTEKGLPAGVPLEVVFPVGSLDVSGYDAVTFEFVYGNCETQNDFDIRKLNRTQIYVSTDGGATFSNKYVPLAYCDYNGDSAQNTSSGDYVSFLYECISGDLRSLVPEGAKITHIKLKPFGDEPVKYGVFRLFEISVTAHSGADYAPPVQADKNVAYMDGVVIDDIRKIAADEIRRYASVEWTPRSDITINVASFEKPLKYLKGTTYKGLVYTQKNYKGTLEEFYSKLNNKNEYTGATDENVMPGTHCSSSIDCAWSLVTTAEFLLTKEMTQDAEQNGLRPLGGLKWGEDITVSKDIYNLNSQQEIFEAFAALKIGDVVMNSAEEGGHVRMITQETVVVRDPSGSVNGSKSYVITTENAGLIKENTSWRVDTKYSFNSLYKEKYLPYTNEAFTSGKVEAPNIYIAGKNDESTVLAGLTGMVISNYRIIELNFKIFDYKGSTVSNVSLFNNTRVHSLYYFTAANKALRNLMKGSYRIVLTAKTGPRINAADDLRITTLLDVCVTKGGAKQAAYVEALGGFFSDSLFLGQYMENIPEFQIVKKAVGK